MVASFLIIGFSSILLVYWFRYSCLLLLRDNAVEADLFDPRFGFARVQQQLQTSAELEPLYRDLHRDYRLLTYLIEHAASLNLPSLEDRLLVFDYKIMQWYYRITRVAAPQQARHALSEMAAVLGVLVQHMSERAGVQAQA